MLKRSAALLALVLALVSGLVTADPCSCLELGQYPYSRTRAISVTIVDGSPPTHVLLRAPAGWTLNASRFGLQLR